MLLSIVIPVFNEEQNLPKLIESLEQIKINNVSIEIIFVDDCSTDDSINIIDAYSQINNNIKFIRLSKNYGSHIAIIAGMQNCLGDYCVFMAGDMQDPPELIHQLYYNCNSGNNVVWAVRENIKGVSLISKVFSRIFYWVMNKFSSVSFPPTGADFAILDRLAIKATLDSVGANPSLGGIIASIGFKQDNVKYVKQYRFAGKSKWTLQKKINAFIDAFVSFSFAPMRLMIYFGGIISILSFLYAIIIIVLRLFFIQQIDGWTSLIVVVLFLGGIQMLMIGILGEYLWRNLEEARKKPLFLIEYKSKNV